jgi:hypothetical protein
MWIEGKFSTGATPMVLAVTRATGVRAALKDWPPL